MHVCFPDDVDANISGLSELADNLLTCILLHWFGKHVPGMKSSGYTLSKYHLNDLHWRSDLRFLRSEMSP